MLLVQFSGGRSDALPDLNDILLLAGRKWRVVDIDTKRGYVFVKPTSARKAPIWVSGGGEIDDRIVQRMRRVLEEDVQYGYLQDGALKHLADARAIARKEGVLSSIFSGEAGHLLLHPWLGTRKLNTLGMLLRTALKEPLGIYTIKPFQCGLGIEIQRNPEAGDFLVELKKRLASVDEADICLSFVSWSSVKTIRSSVS